jgi:phytoene dehydrogenase-like protein
MADYQLVIIGAGLSGIAAGIRAARFGLKTLLLEQHSIPGGLNSYYTRKGHLFETGLHAMTNFAEAGNKRAPLNVLFRQLKLSRKSFRVHQQLVSKIQFPDRSLLFSNNSQLLEQQIAQQFPESIDRFIDFKKLIEQYDPFVQRSWMSSRSFLAQHLNNPDLEEMLLLPLMVYGNPEENDMDLAQFVIMFRAIFEDGLFRPDGTIREFLDFLLAQFKKFDGEIRYRSRVEHLIQQGDTVTGLRLDNGDEISAEAVISTIGVPGTINISGWDLPVEDYQGRVSFMETVSLLSRKAIDEIDNSKTIIFYNHQQQFSYRRPSDFLDTSWGVLCFPQNFDGIAEEQLIQIRITSPANYKLWKNCSKVEYLQHKKKWNQSVLASAAKVIGSFSHYIRYQDCFTPVTIERYTGKKEGAVYGSPIKVKDGQTPWSNLFIAGTDQGFLGIVGSMLSGVTIVNRHLL